MLIIVTMLIYDLSTYADKFDGIQFHLSNPHTLLMDLAQEHSEYMAAREKQDHSRFNERYDLIKSRLNLSATEICAESWVWETKPEEIALSMFKSWEYSPGHWRVASKIHKFYGEGLARGQNGIWYATVLVAD
jgi:hypothetical protein